MSYNIVILKPMRPGIADLANVDEVLDIGDEASVLESLAQVLPGCIQGVFAKDDSFTIGSCPRTWCNSSSLWPLSLPFS
ncbi:hypothetical protein [Pseudomonas vanderleydeniana]|uniref:Uncharacterized protein n=1 Tax=Pseudomonas vanderleydeniana TaxID=2745495 RepID=A0A9E6PS38_9PSED|nr:hypothetical protein [Pseudomonas vanderleydeniana]QXI31669.1 hypothetical protein HU752_020395 [Pseudomonas vanderleydeniana]